MQLCLNCCCRCPKCCVVVWSNVFVCERKLLSRLAQGKETAHLSMYCGLSGSSSPRRLLCCAHTDAYIHTRKKQEPLSAACCHHRHASLALHAVSHTHPSACSPLSHLLGPLWLICFMLLFVLRLLLLFVKVVLAQPEVASAGRTAVAALLHTLLSRALLGFLSLHQAYLNNKLVGCV